MSAPILASNVGTTVKSYLTKHSLWHHRGSHSCCLAETFPWLSDNTSHLAGCCLRLTRQPSLFTSPPWCADATTNAHYSLVTASARNQSNGLYSLWRPCSVFKRCCCGEGGGEGGGAVVCVPLSYVKTCDISQSAVFCWIFPSYLWIFCGQVGRSAGGRVENTVLHAHVGVMITQLRCQWSWPQILKRCHADVWWHSWIKTRQPADTLLLRHF